MELWLHTFAIPGRTADVARRAEAWGFDGLLVADSQNLTADIWVELALAAAATTRLRVGPGVTNPVTRNLAVTASAAATLQAESDGRAVLGFARGDSALSQVGLHAPAAARFAEELDVLQGLLRGETVDLDGTPSTIHWLAGSTAPKVPVHVAATGPKVIGLAAARVEGVDLTVGAEPDRLRAGIAAARAAGPAGLVLGAFLNVAVDDDPAVGRALVRGSVSTFARFATDLRAAGYERDDHGAASSAFAQGFDDAFVDRFAVVGAPAQVRERLAAIAAAGVQRIVVVPGSVDADPAALRRSDERFAAEVLPALRRA